ncbi:BON1-associated protein 2 [Apostasia shenzhenica]|uniref:BON1-associated protein 2 n=1 Tax=Apostasia shenzhenica TaxID=1088818 RepID=A0A2I0ASB6_9ASPA|nr:BON1-associated protein 2 [Apostasia shenzhenica]
MAYRTLDLTLVSAKDLKRVNLFSRMRIYAVVSLSSDGPRSRQRTASDIEGGRNPSWNTTLQFTIPAGDPGLLLLRIYLRSQRLLGDRDVGFVHVPLRDIVAGACHGSKPVQFLSYQVRRPVSGKPKGVLNLSCKLGEPIVPSSVYSSLPAVAVPVPAPAKANPESAMAYPAYGAPAQPYPPAGYFAAMQPYAYGYGGVTSALPAGYGYQPAGYGYKTAPAVKTPKTGRSGMGIAAGVMGGALGGLLIGDMISDASAYDAGYAAGFDDGFDV